MLCFHFHSSKYFLISLRCLFEPISCSSVNFHTYEFSRFPLLMISNFMPLWSENILCIFIFLNLLRLDLWPNIWSILENVPCTFEKNVYSIVEQQHKHIQNTVPSVLYMFVLFKSFPYLLSGCVIHYCG